MAKASQQQVATRRRCLLELLCADEQHINDLCQQLPGRPSRRTITDDLAWVQKLLPNNITRQRKNGHVTWSLRGSLPHVLDEPLDVLTADQVVALIAARSLMRLPDANIPQLERQQQSPGTLSAAIDRMVTRCGLSDTVKHIAPSIIMASRHGIPHEPPNYFLTVVEAILQQRAIEFTYDNNRNQNKSVHTQPQRLVAIHGAWYCFSWSPDKATPPGRIKQYRLARMTDLHMSAKFVPGLPSYISPTDIDDCLAESFGATGSARVEKRKRIILGVSPDGWPYLRDCTWGTRQTWDDNPLGLPTGYKRLSFTTTGLSEARHKILSLGATVQAEGPPELVEWLHEQATAILAAAAKQRATLIAKSPATRISQL